MPLPFLAQAGIALGTTLLGNFLNRPRRPRGVFTMPPAYNTLMQFQSQLASPTYNLSAFRNIAQAPTFNTYAQMMAMRGGNALQANMLYEQARRQNMGQALSTYQQYRLGLDSLRGNMLATATQMGMEMQGLKAQNAWVAQQRQASFFNSLLQIGGTLAGNYLGYRYGMNMLNSLQNMPNQSLMGVNMLGNVGGFMSPFGMPPLNIG